MDIREEMKPCPFCGGEARLTYSTDNHRQPYVTCDTPKCPGCNTYQWHYHTEAEAIEAWNHRAATDTNVGSKVAKVLNQERISRYKFGSCGACGAPVIKPDKYCSECGAKLEWNYKE